MPLTEQDAKNRQTMRKAITDQVLVASARCFTSERSDYYELLRAVRLIEIGADDTSHSLCQSRYERFVMWRFYCK